MLYTFQLELILNLIWAVEAVIVWQLDLQLPMQALSITTDVVNLNRDQGEVFNII